jgi:hypothetical protein
VTKTIRAYNKHPLRLGPGYKGWITSNKISEQNLFKYMAGDYHPWQQWGRMRGWKDWRLRSRRRQDWKRELREVTKEYARYGLFTGDFPYDFCDKDCCYHMSTDPLSYLLDSYYNYLDSTGISYILDDDYIYD